MNVLVIGTEEQVQILQNRVSDRCHLTHYHFGEDINVAPEYSVSIIFWSENQGEVLDTIKKIQKPMLIELLDQDLLTLINNHALEPSIVGGFAGFSGLIERDLLEVCTQLFEARKNLEILIQDLGFNTVWVENRIGLVTPRIIAMIINEAYSALEAGVAGKEEIDKAMKSGTNYPYGPFEWAEKIGPRKVYLLLQSLLESTNDLRYKPCEYLKKE